MPVLPVCLLEPLWVQFSALLPERPVHDVGHAIIRSDRCRSGCCRQRRNLALARLGTKVLGIDRYKPPHQFGSSTGETRLTRLAVGEGVRERDQGASDRTVFLVRTRVPGEYAHSGRDLAMPVRDGQASPRRQHAWRQR